VLGGIGYDIKDEKYYKPGSEIRKMPIDALYYGLDCGKSLICSRGLQQKHNYLPYSAIGIKYFKFWGSAIP
jgi:hypothetical protein